MKYKLLIIIDMQNDFINQSKHILKLINIKKKICEYLNWNNSYFIFTMDWHNHENYYLLKESKKFSIHCVENSYGSKLIKPMQTIINNLKSSKYQIIKKNNITTDLLKNLIFNINDIDWVEFIGIYFDICVYQNAILLKKLYPKLKIKINPKYCISTNKFNYLLTIIKLVFHKIKIINH